MQHIRPRADVRLTHLKHASERCLGDVLPHVGQNKDQFVFGGRQWRVCVGYGTTAPTKPTVDRLMLHMGFKRGVEDWNERLELIDRSSSHTTQLCRIIDNVALFAHRVPSHFNVYENSISLNLDDVYSRPGGGVVMSEHRFSAFRRICTLICFPPASQG